MLARVQEPRERLASCARRRPGSLLKDAGSIPATSTLKNRVPEIICNPLLGRSEPVLGTGSWIESVARMLELHARLCDESS